jgi:hypothetical protein
MKKQGRMAASYGLLILTGKEKAGKYALFLLLSSFPDN